MLPQTSPEADTLPMIKVAPKVVEVEYVDHFYCTDCGINYSTKPCPNPSRHKKGG